MVSLFSVRTVHETGWATIKNGELLALALGEFELFVTVDWKLAYPQNVPKRVGWVERPRNPSCSVAR